MTDEEEVLKLLELDLAQEYGIAVRYLLLANSMNDLKRPEVAEILTGLARDSVSHSELVRNILLERGRNPKDAFKHYKTTFEDIKLALKSCFYLESHMAKEYSALAQKLGEQHELFDTLTSLANWETIHMDQVLHALELVESLESPKGVEDNRQRLVDRMQQTSKKGSDIEPLKKRRLLLPPKMSHAQEELELTVSEALEKAKKLGESLSGMSKIKEVGENIKDLGTPAEEMMEEDVVRVIFQEKKDYEAYCFKCSEKHMIQDPIRVVIGGDKPAIKGTCPHCETAMISLDI